MAVQRIPLAATMGEREPGDASDPNLKNCHQETVEIRDATGQTQTDIFVTKRPALKSYSDLSAATTDTGRGIYQWEGNMYAVVGNQLFKGTSSIATLNTSSGRVYFDQAFDGTGLMVFHDGVTLYTVDSSDTVAEYNQAGSGGANARASMPTAMVSGIVLLDQYLFLLDVLGSAHNSNVGDVTAWSGDSVNAEIRSDAGVAIARYINYIAIFGEDTIEFLWDAANTNGSPLNRFEGMANLIGCAAGDTVVNADQSLVFVGKSPNGGRFVGIIEGGFETKRISTNAIDEILDKEGSSISNAYAYFVRTAGKKFYVLTLPTVAGRTFVADLNERQWYEWTSDVSDTETYFTGMDSAEIDGTIVLQDEDNGLLYDFDTETFQDNTGSAETVKAEIRTPKWDGETMQNKFAWRLQVIGDLNVSSGPISIAWSDDDYQTWSPNRTQDLDNHQSWLTRCGMFKRRAFRIQHQQNLPMRLSHLEMNSDTGHYARG